MAGNNDRAGSNGSGGNKPAGDKSGSDKPGSDKSGADKSAAGASSNDASAGKPTDSGKAAATPEIVPPPPAAAGKPGIDNAGKPPFGSVSKKPAALIDLKASEVEVREVKREDKAGTTTGTTPGAAAKVEPTAGQSAPPAPGAASAGTTSANAPPASDKNAKPGLSAAAYIKPPEQQGAGAKPASTPANPGRPQSANRPPNGPAPATSKPAAASGTGLRSTATHLAAGLAGGLLALLGADAIGPTLGLQNQSPSGQVADLARRLQALETIPSRQQPGSNDITKKLAATDAKLARVDELVRSVETLSEQQARLAQDAKAVGDKLAQPAPAIPADPRIAKLEDVLTTLSAAAVGDPQTGRIPQLAAITGRIADLESNIKNQIAALRKNVTQEVDSRLSQATEASEGARIGTQRIDRELSTVKTESSQLSNRIDNVKAAAERAEAGIGNLKETTGDLKTALNGIRGDLVRELKQVARPTDVSSAVSPVVNRLAALETNVQGVVKGEDDRRANAERIVLALELGNLKRTVERGVPFATELAEVRKVAGPRLDLGALDRHKDSGVPAVTELARDFRGIAHAMIDADAEPANAGWTERLLAGAKSIVRVRRVDQAGEAGGVEAAVARIDADLKDGKLAEVVAEAGKLQPKVLAPARAWLDKVEARVAVERAVAEIERELKASLGSGVATSKKG